MAAAVTGNEVADAPPPAWEKKKLLLPLADVQSILFWERQPYFNSDSIRSKDDDDDDGEILLLPEELKGRCEEAMRRINGIREAEEETFSEYQARVRSAMDSGGVVMVDGDFFAAEVRDDARAELDEYWGRILEEYGIDSVCDDVFSDNDEEEDDIDSFWWLS